MSFGVSSIRNSDTHSSDMFGLGFTGGGGGGAYGQENSGSMRRVSIGRVVERAYNITYLCSQVPVQWFLQHGLGCV